MLILAIATAARARTRLAAHDLTRPNIVILTDKMGCGDPGCHNAAPRIETPNIDRMTSEGLRVTGAHSAASWCTPTRYGLLTTLLDASRKLECSR